MMNRTYRLGDDTVRKKGVHLCEIRMEKRFSKNDLKRERAKEEERFTLTNY
jgi:hypothetical protein